MKYKVGDILREDNKWESRSFNVIVTEVFTDVYRTQRITKYSSPYLAYATIVDFPTAIRHIQYIYICSINDLELK